MLTLYQMERSPYCEKVRRILRFKGIAFQIREVSLVAGMQHSHTGKLPAIVLDGQNIDDSTQIAHALERLFPEPRLIPRDPAARALCHVLEDWADESLYFYEMGLHFSFAENVNRRLEKLTQQESPLRRRLLKRVLPRILRTYLWAQGTGRRGRARILEDVTRHVQSLADLLERREYLVSDELTLADIAVCVQLNAMCETQAGRDICARQPRVTSWLARVRLRTGG